MDSLRGKLLIASPALIDPNFHRTVILIAEHTGEGAMGLVLNRPAETLVADVVPDLSELAERGRARLLRRPGRLRLRDRARRVRRPSVAGVVLDGDLGFVAQRVGDLDDVGRGVRRARVYAGHSGWGPGQLEGELEEESWIIEPPVREEIFSRGRRGPVGGGAAPQGPRVRAALHDAAGPVGQLDRYGFPHPH